MEFIYMDPIGLTDLVVHEVGKQACKPALRVGPCVRDMYILHYIHSGSGTYTSGGWTGKLGPGAMFLVLPDTVHTYEAASEEPWQYSWFGFKGTIAPRIVEQAGFSAASPVRQAESTLAIAPLLQDVIQLRERPAKELLAVGLLYQLLSALALPDDLPLLRPDAGPHVRSAISFMNARYAEKIGLHDIAEHVGIDSKYLCRLFQQRLSMSPYRYLTDVRMRKACRLLRMQMLGIAEIARSVGYADALLFSRMFKRTIGLSPTVYREKARLESISES